MGLKWVMLIQICQDYGGVYNGNIVPLSRFSFDLRRKCGHYLEEIWNLSVKNDKVIEGALQKSTRIFVNNDEAKAYVS